MDNKFVGARIKQRRKTLGLTLNDVAQEIGVAKSTIQRYETGAIEKIKLPVIEAIARAIHTNPAWLCGKSEIVELEPYEALRQTAIEKVFIDQFRELSIEDMQRALDSISDFIPDHGKITPLGQKPSGERVVNESEYRIVAAYRVASKADRGIIDNIVDRYAPAQSGEAAG